MKKYSVLAATMSLLLFFVPAARSEEQDRLVVLSSSKPAFSAGFTEDTGIAVEMRNYTSDIMEQISQIFVTRNGDVDIFCLPAHMGLYSVKAKGFYYPLNDTAVGESIKQLYPLFAQA